MNATETLFLFLTFICVCECFLLDQLKNSWRVINDLNATTRLQKTQRVVEWCSIVTCTILTIMLLITTIIAGAHWDIVHSHL